MFSSFRKKTPSIKSIGSLSDSASMASSVGPKQKCTVEVPAGLGPGDTLRCELPGGKVVDMLLPAGAHAGTTIEVEQTVDVFVAIPKGTKPGDTLQVSHEGATVAFTVPAGTRAGSKIKVAIPASSLAPTADDAPPELDADVRSVTVKVPYDWDGCSAIETHVDAERPILFQAPVGARAGDEVVLDLPPAGQKVAMSFEVPWGVSGGDVLGIHSPSGHLKFVSLPPDAQPGKSLSVRIADEPDADAAAASGKGDAKKALRAALQARSVEMVGSPGYGTPVGKKKKQQAVFTVLAAVPRVEAK